MNIVPDFVITIICVVLSVTLFTIVEKVTFLVQQGVGFYGYELFGVRD